jgi:hypothetical protein
MHVSRHSRAALVLSFAVFVAAGSIWQMYPPPPAAASASPQAFSAARATRHVAVIAVSPACVNISLRNCNNSDWRCRFNPRSE